MVGITNQSINNVNPESKKQNSKNKSFTQGKQINFLSIFVVITAVVQLLIFTQQAVTLIWLSRLAKKPAPSLVQMLDGKTVEVSALPSKKRTPDTIKKFTSDIMTLLFSARGVISREDESTETQLDEGVELSGLPIQGRNKRIATPAYEASFALSEDFRGEFLTNLAEITPPMVFRGKTQTMLIIRHLSDPKPIVNHLGEEIEGEYVVKMIADMLIFTTTNTVGKTIPVNKEIYLRSVFEHSLPLPDDATQLEREIYRIRTAGLEIYHISEFDLK